MTLDYIKRKNHDAGHHFFERDTMRFFDSRILSTLYYGEGGVYFVTSEKFRGHGTPDGPRLYTVRSFDPETGSVDTAGPFNKLSRYTAQAAARDLASGKTKYCRECGEIETHKEWCSLK